MEYKKSNKLSILAVSLVFFVFVLFMISSNGSNLTTGYYLKKITEPVSFSDPEKAETYSDTLFILLFVILLVVLFEYRRRKMRVRHH